MKTLNNHFKVTESELKTLTNLFNQGVTIFRKVILFGAGHPQLPTLFGVTGNVSEFMEDHETTHAKFIAYNSISDIISDKDFWRYDLTPQGCEFDDMSLSIYKN